MTTQLLTRERNRFKLPMFGNLAQLVEHSAYDTSQRDASISKPDVQDECGQAERKSKTWELSSAGRAFGLHPNGRGFDPLSSHQNAAAAERTGLLSIAIHIRMQYIKL